MGIHALADQLKATPISLAISGSDTIFPLLECVHVVAVATVVGSIAIVDLRLMGLRARSRDVNELLAQFVPIALGAFVVAFVAGALMFVAKPDTYIDNLFFDVKMVLLLMAGANMLAFHFAFRHALAGVGAGGPLPWPARISGALSLTFWVAIIACGRWIGFTT